MSYVHSSKRLPSAPHHAVEDREVEAVAVVRDDDVVAAERANFGQMSANGGAIATSAARMPCVSIAPAAIGTSGFTSALNTSTICPSRTRTAAISTISALSHVLVRRLDVDRREVAKRVRRVADLEQLRRLERAEHEPERRHVVRRDGVAIRSSGPSTTRAVTPICASMRLERDLDAAKARQIDVAIPLARANADAPRG